MADPRPCHEVWAAGLEEIRLLLHPGLCHGGVGVEGRDHCD